MSTMEESREDISSNSENTANIQDESEATINKIIEELTVDYRDYLNFDITKEQTKYYESIEGMLTKLDEFCGLVDLIRSDTNLCINMTLPKIHSKFDEMRHIFERIDKLVKFVSIVKQNVTVMEEKVNEAEKDLGDSIGSGIMKRLSSIVGSKKVVDKKKAEYEEPVIFITDDYFPKDNTYSKTNTSTNVETR